MTYAISNNNHFPSIRVTLLTSRDHFWSPFWTKSLRRLHFGCSESDQKWCGRTDEHTSILDRSLHNKPFGQLDHTLLARYGPAGTPISLKKYSLIDSRVKFDTSSTYYPFSCITDPKSSKFVLRSKIPTFLDFSEKRTKNFDRF